MPSSGTRSIPTPPTPSSSDVSIADRALHTASRIKRRVHAASAPRTPPAPSAPDLLDVLFPSGMAHDDRLLADQLLATAHVDAATIRKIIGHVDLQRSPTPFSVHLTASDIAYLPVGDDELAVDTCDRSVSVPTLESGVWEPQVERIVRRFLGSGDTFVDIGANIGYHTLVASQVVGPEGRVIAFEPNPDNARLIAHTIERNAITNITVLPVALASERGVATFRHAIGSNGGFADAGSSPLLEANSTVVPTMVFDDLAVGHVDVVKIDVEGGEPIVLAGAARLLDVVRPVIIFEFSVEMTERVGGTSARAHLGTFTDRGYELSLIERASGELIPVDSIDELLATWGDRGRIEDLVAIPAGHPPAR